MTGNIFLITFLQLIVKLFSLLSNETNEEFFKKYTKEITPDSFNSLGDIELNFNDIQINYNFDEIVNIIKKYDFKYSYNFFDEFEEAKFIQNQGSCRCCWTFASSTALAYRFYKNNIKIKLSAQYPVSCLTKTCEKGIYRIDNYMNLVNTGTVPEGCLPYTSQNLTVEECPIKCKDGSNLEFYKAKNIYVVEKYKKEDYYEIVALIMDQLIKHGPVSAGIILYDDFGVGEKPDDYIYTYDGISKFSGYHMVVIVGYGHTEEKFYWIIQNSWGENYCNHGLCKIEFGQIGIEHVSFASPNIDKNVTVPVEVNVTLESLDIDKTCELKVSGNTDTWKDTLKITFQHQESNSEIIFQCGVNEIVGNKKVNCYFAHSNQLNDEGYYQYKDSSSLGKENTFSLNDFNESKFYFRGPQILEPISKEVENQKYYVSQEGSMIFFKTNDKGKSPKVYVDSKILSNCKKEEMGEFGEYNFLKCVLNSKEINYFTEKETIIQNSYLCGDKKKKTNLKVYKLDKKKYPVYKIKKKINSFQCQKDKNFCMCQINVKVEGNIPKEYNNNNEFAVLVKWEKNKDEEEYVKQMNCKTTTNTCSMEYVEGPFKNIELLPYYWIIKSDYPFEIISYSFKLNFNLISILLIILMIY